MHSLLELLGELLSHIQYLVHESVLVEELGLV